LAGNRGAIRYFVGKRDVGKNSSFLVRAISAEPRGVRTLQYVLKFKRFMKKDIGQLN
jgi:hypothetical protein